MALESLAGSTLRVGGEDVRARRTPLFFLSPTCPVCKTLLPTLRRILAEEPGGVRIVYASDGEVAEHRAFASEHGLDDRGYVLSRELGMRFEVSKLPFAVLIVPIACVP